MFFKSFVSIYIKELVEPGTVYKHTNDLPKYAELLNTQCNTYYWDAPRELESNAIDLVETFYDAETALHIKRQALSWIARGKELSPNSWQAFYAEAVVYYYYLSNITRYITLN